MLLRVPGIGARSAYRITESRRYGNLDFDDLRKMRVVLKRAKHFITCKHKFYGYDNYEKIKNTLLVDGIENEQLSLFSTPTESLSALNGEL